MNNKIKRMKIDILFWYFSFFPLIICFVLFVLYFVFDTSYFYYMWMIISLIVFAVLYSIANKRIICGDGYTLINAISFYKNCVKENVENENQDIFFDNLIKVSKNFEYTEDLNLSQLKQLYEIGKVLSNRKN